MTLTQFVDRMKELDSPIAVVSIVLLCLFLAVIIIKMLAGAFRGSFRQLLGVGATLFSAVVSCTAAVILSNSIMGETDMKNMQDFITFMEGIIPGSGDFITQLMSSFDSEAFEYSIIIPVTLIFAPLLATTIFIILNLILKIVRGVIVKIFRLKRARSSQQRLGGALLGGVDAIIWMIMVTLPISGIVALADRACTDALESDGGEDTSLLTTYEEIVSPLSQNPAFTFMDALGSSAVADEIATITVNDQKTNIRDEISAILHVVLVEIPALDGADFNALTEDNKASIDNVIDSLDRSPFIATVVATVVQNSSGFINNNIPIDKNGEYSELFSGLVTFLEGVSSESLADDLATLKEVYFILSDSGILAEIKEDGDVMSLLEEKRKDGDDALIKIVTALQSNKRTAPLVTALTKTLLSSLSTTVEAPDGSTVTISYDSVKDGMNNVLAVEREDYATEKEYKDALAGTLDQTFRDNGIHLDDEIVGTIANYIDEEYSHLDQLNDQQFNDVLLYYYDAYLQYIN